MLHKCVNPSALALLHLEESHTAPDVIRYSVWVAVPLILRPVVANLWAIPNEAILAPPEAT